MIVTADLHLTIKARDEYRWGIFPWLRKQCLKYKDTMVIILGDLTDQKDKHSSILVNRLIENLTNLAEVAHVYILRGNHDCIDPREPFFNFLDRINSKMEINFIKEPTGVSLRNTSLIFLPHSKQPEEDWKDLTIRKGDYIFTHLTMSGSIASNGHRLEGLSDRIFGRFEGDIYSGDIHVPQIIGRVTYVGAPYHIRFGDSYDPRILIIDREKKTKNIYFPCLQKHTIDISKPNELHDYNNLEPGDQVKIRMHLERSEFVDWGNQKRLIIDICKDLDLDLWSIELQEKRVTGEEVGSSERETLARIQPSDIIKTYCNREGVSGKLRKAGIDLLDA